MDAAEFGKMSREEKIETLTDGLKQVMPYKTYQERCTLATRMASVEDEMHVDSDTLFVIMLPISMETPGVMAYAKPIMDALDIAYRLGRADRRVEAASVGVIGIN